MSVQTFSALSQEKGKRFPSKEDFSSVGWKSCSSRPRRENGFEVWIAVGLILIPLPVAMKNSVDVTIDMFFSWSQV